MNAEPEASRRRFEASLERLRGAVESEFGMAPRLGRWAGVVVALAVGFLAGNALRGRLDGRARRRRSLGR